MFFSFSAEYVRLILHEDIASRIVLRNIRIIGCGQCRHGNAGHDEQCGDGRDDSVNQFAHQVSLDMPLVPKPAENLI